ncbi:MAG: NUDIX hydrolase [Limisphaerales bacterium]
MSDESDANAWLAWARELQALGQTGLHFAQDPYDRDRYGRLIEIAAGMVAGQSNLTVPELLQYHAAEFGYATPKVDVRGVVFRDDRILLVQELADERRWTLPGGWADVNESPAGAVTREVSEESGFAVVARKLLAVWDREKHGHLPPFPYHVYKLFFRCEIVGGEARSSNETGEVAFFSESELPELSVGRVTQAQIFRLFEHLRQPELPTDFD